MFLSSDERIAECVALLKVAVNSTFSLECIGNSARQEEQEEVVPKQTVT